MVGGERVKGGESNGRNDGFEYGSGDWGSLAEVEYAGDRDENEALGRPALDPEIVKEGMGKVPFVSLGVEKAETNANLVSVDDFYDEQPIERQNEMRRDFVDLEQIHLDINSVNDPQEKAVYQQNLIHKKADIVERHIDEPDCIEYLMSVTNESIEVAVMDMFLTDPKQTIGKFGKISSMLEEKFGENADQAAYNILQQATLGEGMLWMRNDYNVCMLGNGVALGYAGIFQLPKASDYEELLEIGQERDLQIDEAFLDTYMDVASSSKDEADQDRLLNNIDLLREQGMAPEKTLEWFCRNGKFDEMMERVDYWAQYGIDAKSYIEQFIEKAISTPENIAIKVVRNPEAYQNLGINAKSLIENNVPRIWLAAQYDVLAKGRTLAKLGIDVNQIPKDSKNYYVELNQGYQEEFKGKDVSAAELPKGVLDDWRKNTDRTFERSREENLEPMLANFMPQRWEKLRNNEREQAIKLLAEKISEVYGINHPYEVKFVASDKLSVKGAASLVTNGQHCPNYKLARDPVMHDFAEKAHEAGLDLNWLPYSKIEINKDRIDDGPEVAGTLTHEMRHAFQFEQEFLWRRGYYNQPEPKGDFEYLPDMARYFAGNSQVDCYRKAEDSYAEYRKQLIEHDAFYFGNTYVEMVKNIADRTEKREQALEREEMEEVDEMKEAEGMEKVEEVKGAEETRKVEVAKGVEEVKETEELEETEGSKGGRARSWWRKIRRKNGKN